MGSSSTKPSLASIPFLFFTLDHFLPADVKKIVMRFVHESTSIMQVSCGSFQSLALLPNGSLYAWGSNADGQLGTTLGGKLESLVPTKTGLEGIAAICCGGYHSMALTKEGVVYAWGANNHGQLGNGQVTGKTARPQRVTMLDRERVCAIACGQYHSLALTASGHLYAWGNNENGQLGNGTKLDEEEEPEVEQEMADALPQRVPLAHVVAISCGGFHSLALTKEGKLFAWGLNDSGQLGLGTTRDAAKTLTPQAIALEHVTAMSCGELHSVALTKDGKLYAWGNNTDGQLGDGSLTRSKVPRLIKIDQEVTAISCGGRHTLALTKNRQLLAWGSNYFGQLGLGFRRRTKYPKRVDIEGVFAMACGEYHSLALSLDGKLYGFGNNENGQLGNGSDAHIHEPRGQVSRLVHVPPDTSHSHGHSASTSLASSGKKLSEKIHL